MDSLTAHTKTQRTYDLLTSCDDNLALLLLPQIASMRESLGGYNVNLHLAHSSITPEHIAQIADFSFDCGVNFFEHLITDNSKYKIIAEGGGIWPPEAYYPLLANEYLTCDRAMYFDAGDVIFNGDIARYYFEDFRDNILIATPIALFMDKDDNPLPFSEQLLTNKENIKRVSRGIINSGSYILNLEIMREINLCAKDFIGIKDGLAKLLGTTENLYWGDQGLISMAFLGKILMPTLPYTHNVYFMPYNFCVWFYDRFDYLWYEPFVIHFAAGRGKPWKSTFKPDEIKKIIENAESGNPPEALRYSKDFYDLYFRYAKLTPVYDFIKETAINNANKNI
jgi:lipopolysaccharide biosynthesis glycosyltransferase